MFPMVSEPWEFDAAKAVFDHQLAYPQASASSTLPEAIRYGVMLEVPSLAEVLDVLLPKLVLPLDRHQRPDPVPVRRRPGQSQAGRTLRLAEPVDPAVPAPGGRTTASGTSVDLGVCGEMGGRRLEALALLGLGIRRLSITPAAVGPIKELVRRIDTDEIGAAMKGWLATPPQDMRAELAKWAAEHEIEVD